MCFQDLMRYQGLGFNKRSVGLQENYRPSLGSRYLRFERQHLWFSNLERCFPWDPQGFVWYGLGLVSCFYRGQRDSTKTSPGILHVQKNLQFSCHRRKGGTSWHWCCQSLANRGKGGGKQTKLANASALCWTWAASQTFPTIHLGHVSFKSRSPSIGEVTGPQWLRVDSWNLGSDPSILFIILFSLFEERAFCEVHSYWVTRGVWRFYCCYANPSQGCEVSQGPWQGPRLATQLQIESSFSFVSFEYLC